MVIADYPQLHLIAWSSPGLDELDEPTAFALYERNWRHIDLNSLNDKELAFIEYLKNRYGNGVMNV